MSLRRLYLNHMTELDRLMALEFGRAYDGQPAENWHGVGEDFGFLRDYEDGPIVGFGVNGFSEFDVDDPDVAEIWSGPHFEVRLVGLPKASAAEVVLAARPLLGDHSTINRQFFSAAAEAQDHDPEQALWCWLSCLEAGDSMAHFALGYTLYELGRYHEAYRHLRYYAQISPAAAWTWRWLGKAAQALGELNEARTAYQRAIELSEREDDTDAPALLAGLDDMPIARPARVDSSIYLEDVDDQRREPAGAGPRLGKRFEEALAFAAEKHRTQVRKGSGVPYIGHLLGVCSLVIEDGGDEDEAIAALLHDAAEDQGGEKTLAEIRDRFGDAVADIVLACSDTLEEPKPKWRARKEAYLEHLEHQPEPVLHVSLADKLFNARAILRDYLLVGEELWTRFKSGRDGQLWYYRELADVFARLLPGRMSSELTEVVHALEQTVLAY